MEMDQVYEHHQVGSGPVKSRVRAVPPLDYLPVLPLVASPIPVVEEPAAIASKGLGVV